MRRVPNGSDKWEEKSVVGRCSHEDNCGAGDMWRGSLPEFLEKFAKHHLVINSFEKHESMQNRSAYMLAALIVLVQEKVSTNSQSFCSHDDTVYSRLRLEIQTTSRTLSSSDQTFHSPH
jgi:hypothetical protein